MNAKLETCLECDHGRYREVVKQYETAAADGVQILIPNARFLLCDSCGHELLPPETQRQIDEAVAEQTERISIQELEEIPEKYGLDQCSTSEALGLGVKTFHRWLNGSQHPSRSMGFYLRAIIQFPEVFEWIKDRKWRHNNRISHFQSDDLKTRFRDLEWLRLNVQAYESNRLDAIFAQQTHVRSNPATLFRQTQVK